MLLQEVTSYGLDFNRSGRIVNIEATLNVPNVSYKT